MLKLKRILVEAIEERSGTMSKFARRLQQSANKTSLRTDPLTSLITAAPPVGLSPTPSGPMTGSPTEFDYTRLATNEIWDHFDGSVLDDRLWLRDYINQGGTQQYHDPGLFLDGNSHAVMECTQSGGTIYSGRFTSRQRFAMQYGWCAARIKMPHALGTVGRSWFPAFWLLLVGYNTSSYYAEFDIIEQFGNSSVYSTHLYSNRVNNLESYVDVPASHSSDASQDFHTYWMLWEPNCIRVGVDAVVMGDWVPADLPASVWAHHMCQPMY